MKYSDIKNNVYVYMLFFMILTSCKSHSSLSSIYIGGFYPDFAYLNLQHINNSYVYSYVYDNYTYNEIGIFTSNNDTLILTPKFCINNGKCEEYDTKAWYLTIKNDTVYSKDINSRIYVLKNKKAKDISLQFYYPNDSSAHSFYENFSLNELDIRQIDIEKKITKYGGKKYKKKLKASELIKLIDKDFIIE